MSDINPVPNQIAQEVNRWVSEERQLVAEYDNREFFDRSGMFGLHDLVRAAYADGWQAGRLYALEADRTPA